MDTGKIPEKVTMIIVAVIGSSIGWLTYELIYYVNPLQSYRSSSSWFIEFIIGVARQHSLHRWFTFTHIVPYWKSLGKAYIFYASSTSIGAGVNIFLTEYLHVHHRLAWGTCLIITALISLFGLKKVVFTSISKKSG